MRKISIILFLSALFSSPAFSQLNWWNIQGETEISSGKVYSTALHAPTVLTAVSNDWLFALQCRVEGSSSDYVFLIGTDQMLDIPEDGTLTFEMAGNDNIVLYAAEKKKYLDDHVHITYTTNTINGNSSTHELDVMAIPYVITKEQITRLSEENVRKVSLKGEVLGHSISFSKDKFAKFIKSLMEELDGMMSEDSDVQIPPHQFAQVATSFIRQGDSFLDKSNDSSENNLAFDNSSTVENKSNAKVIYVNDLGGTEIGPLSSGYFVIYRKKPGIRATENYGLAQIYDINGNITGTVELNFGFRNSLLPVFSKEGTAVTFIDEEPAIINVKGEIIKRFAGASNVSSRFEDGVAALFFPGSSFSDKSIIQLVDNKGNNIIPEIKIKTINLHSTGYDDFVSPLCDNRRRISIKESTISDVVYGYIDNNGFFVIKPQYKNAHDFSEGVAAVQINDPSLGLVWQFIDTNGKPIFEQKFQKEPGDFHDGFAVVKDKKNIYYFIDKKGNMSSGYNFAISFFNGLALVDDNEINGTNCHFIDKSFKPVYSNITVNLDGLVNFVTSDTKSFFDSSKMFVYLESFAIRKHFLIFDYSGNQPWIQELKDGRFEDFIIDGYSRIETSSSIKETRGSTTVLSHSLSRSFIDLNGNVILIIKESEF